MFKLIIGITTKQTLKFVSLMHAKRRSPYISDRFQPRPGSGGLQRTCHIGGRDDPKVSEPKWDATAVEKLIEGVCFILCQKTTQRKCLEGFLLMFTTLVATLIGEVTYAGTCLLESN